MLHKLKKVKDTLTIASVGLFLTANEMLGAPSPSSSPTTKPADGSSIPDLGFDYQTAVMGIVEAAKTVFLVVMPIVIAIVGFKIVLSFVKVLKSR